MVSWLVAVGNLCTCEILHVCFLSEFFVKLHCKANSRNVRRKDVDFYRNVLRSFSIFTQIFVVFATFYKPL